MSLYEFWWKYAVYKGRVKRSTRPVCIMVTPCFSADCANVEHASHESYARAAVIAYWRHMSRDRRHAVTRAQMEFPVKAVPAVCFGATEFTEPFANAAEPEEDRQLGVRDLYMKFEGVRDGRGVDEGWSLALMEMLTDPMLRHWVPEWVVEQYERANPFYKEVLTALVSEDVQRNRQLLKRTKREMVKRHHRHLKKVAEKEQRGQSSSSDEGGADGDESDVAGDATLTSRPMTWRPSL